MTPSRLKILWLSHLIPYPPKGGALIRSYHLIKNVSKYHNVDLLAFDQKSIFPSYYGDHQKGLLDAKRNLSQFLNSYSFFTIPTEKKLLGKHISALMGLISSTPYTMRWLISPEFDAAITEKLDKNNYDAIHCDTISLANYIADLPVPNKPVTILNHHNIESDMMLRRAKKSKNPIKKLYFLQEGVKIRNHEKKLTKKYALNIVCSHADKEILQRSSHLSPNKISVVANGIIPPHSILREPNHLKPKLLFVGGLNWYPNKDAIHHFLDEIWPRLRDHVPYLTVDIVGKNPSSKILSHSAADARIRAHGFVNDISQFYREATIYICPIRDGGGTKLKILDALGHGLPIVAYPAACEGIDIVNKKHAIIASSAQEFSTAIIDLLQDFILLNQLSINGPSLVKQQYTASKIGLDYAKMIEKLSLGL